MMPSETACGPVLRRMSKRLHPVIAVVIIGTIILAAPTLAAAPKPSVTSFKAIPSKFGSSGGTTTLTASVTHSSTCTFSVTPSVKGLPATVACASNKASKKVVLPKDNATTAKSYTFSLKASGPGGSTRAKPQQVSVSPVGRATTALHYTANANFDSNGKYLPGADGFDLADIGSNDQGESLLKDVKGLAWIGLCDGADSNFTSTITPYIGDSRVFGFYLMDEPDPSSCPAAKLKAESDWIHAHDPGALTFVILQDLGQTSDPTFQGTYNPANSDIDLYGLDPYPCRTELHNSCDYPWIGLAVRAAERSGVPLKDIVPVYQAFGGGTYTDDGGGKYLMPSPSQETQILTTWGQVVPSPVFDYAYSWGVQDNDTSLVDSPGDQAVFLAHNRPAGRR